MKEIIKTELIDQFIKEQGLTRTRFCKLCKMSYGTFVKIRRGECNVKMNAIFRMARVMRIKVHELFKK